jgi:peptidoglycan/xylan/chitin deacetylase (PgdA/CDA1 family)
MYIGSVRFFKHLILMVLALLIIIPMIGCSYFAVQYKNLHAQVTFQLGLLTPLAPVPDEPVGYSKASGTDETNRTDEVNGTDENGADNAAGDNAANADNAKAVPIPYQLMYPHLYIENDFQYIEATEKTIYLTFDDGPTLLTPQVLDILKDKGIHATFFVMYQQGNFAETMYKRIVDEGHALALHSASHDYNRIYASVEAFLDDFAFLSDTLEEVTGVKPELFRFPGGSNNSYVRKIQQELIAELLRRGYTYYDWDVSSASSSAAANTSSIYSSVINGVSGRHSAIVLMHDAGTSATVTALPGIIDTLATRFSGETSLAARA